MPDSARIAWQPWSARTIERARRDGKPLLLRIDHYGCAAAAEMQRSADLDPATLAVIEAAFVPVRVDRDEVPELDRLCQLAHQLLTQTPGGWPLHVCFDADAGLPFFSATWLPRTPTQGLPGFATLLARVRDFHAGERSTLQQQHAALRAALAELSPPALEFTPDASPLRRARIAIERGFERTHGGFGNGPKFIRTNLLERLLRDWRRSATSAEPDLQALFMVSLTLTRIAASPMRHASGLFHSHAARIDWSEPEPLLSAEDNGLLLALYAQLALATGERDFLRITRETAAALLQTLRLPDGAFAAHLDGGTAAAAARDERALIAPNAQVIRGLAWAARVLRDPALADAALAAIGAIGARHFRDGALRRADGRCADLDAHAALADAVLEALQQRWHAPTADLQRALLVALRTHFEDPVLGGFHAAADDAEPAPFQRLKIFADEATPAGNALAARVLLRAGALTEDRAAIEAARRTLALAWPAIQQQPQAHATLLGVLEETLSPPEVLVLRGAGDEIETARSDLQKVYAPTRLVFAIPEAAD